MCAPLCCSCDVSFWDWLCRCAPLCLLYCHLKCWWINVWVFCCYLDGWINEFEMQIACFWEFWELIMLDSKPFFVIIVVCSDNCWSFVILDAGKFHLGYATLASQLRLVTTWKMKIITISFIALELNHVMRNEEILVNLEPSNPICLMQ
jgi:hypothetical protein